MRTLCLCGCAVFAMTLASWEGAQAQSSESYIGSTWLSAATFCPRGTMEADGRTLQIAQHSSLFALIGINYGGDGRTAFNLPDLRAATPLSGDGMRYCIVVEGTFPSRP